MGAGKPKQAPRAATTETGRSPATRRGAAAADMQPQLQRPGARATARKPTTLAAEATTDRARASTTHTASLQWSTQLSGNHCPANDNEDSEVAVAQILVWLSLKTGATTKGATVAPANPVFSIKPAQYRV